MSYIRRLLSKNTLNDGRIIRRYEVETPRHVWWRDRVKLEIMELQLSPGAAWYYSDTPWTLANQMWAAFCIIHDDVWLDDAFMPYHAEDPDVEIGSCDDAIGIEVTTGWDWIAKPPKWPLERIIELVESGPRNKNKTYSYSMHKVMQKIDAQSSKGSL